MTKFTAITRAEGVFLGVSHTPTTRDGASALPNFWGSLLFMHTLWRRTTKFDVVTHMGRELITHAPPEGGWAPALSNFGGSFQLTHTSIVTELLNLAWWRGEGRVSCISWWRDCSWCCCEIRCLSRMLFKLNVQLTYLQNTNIQFCVH